MDREKVIEGLECCLKESDHMYSNPCNSCPYEGQECIDRMKADALAMLKEQEAVTVHNPGAYCPKCGWMLYPEDHPHNCGNCGQAVKWE